MLAVESQEIRRIPRHKPSCGYRAEGFEDGPKGYAMGMPFELPVLDAEALLAYVPERYWAVWQIPEDRYAYSIEESRRGWFVLIESEANAVAVLLADAKENDRQPSEYRLDSLTLPDALDAARSQEVPFRSTQGLEIVAIGGVILLEANAVGSVSFRPIPF